MKKLYLLTFILSSISLCNGGQFISFDSIEHDIRYVLFDNEYYEQFFITTLSIDNNPDIHDIAYLGIRPTSGSPVSIGHGTINIYDANGSLLDYYCCLDDYLDPLQYINGASVVHYIGPADVYSTDGWGEEEIWYVEPSGSIPLELVFVPEPATLSLLALGAMLAGRKKRK